MAITTDEACGLFETHLDGEIDRPLAVLIPECYEPNYAYPLIVALHDEGERETQWLNVAPMLSLRNYVVLALRGPRTVRMRDGRTGYSWRGGVRRGVDVHDYVSTAVNFVSDRLSIDSERVSVAGAGEGAGVAYELAAGSPDRFARLIAFDGQDGAAPLARFLRAHQRTACPPRVFLGAAVGDSGARFSAAERQHRLLRSAGITSELHLYADGDGLPRTMLRDLDHWLLDWPRP